MHSEFDLKYIINNWFGFLTKELGFKLESFEKDNRENAIAIVNLDKIKLRFIRERWQNFMDVASNCRPNDFEDIHLIKYLLTGYGNGEGLLSKVDADFFKQYKLQIEDLFSEEKVDDTLKKIKEIKKNRSDELFG